MPQFVVLDQFRESCLGPVVAKDIYILAERVRLLFVQDYYSAIIIIYVISEEQLPIGERQFRILVSFRLLVPPSAASTMQQEIPSHIWNDEMDCQENLVAFSLYECQ